jgi:hypothetical protein
VKVLNTADHEAFDVYAEIDGDGTAQVVVLIPSKTSAPSVGGVVAKQATEARLVQPRKA